MVMYMGIKAVYENKVLKPLEKLALKEGEEVEIEIKKNIVEKTFGISKLNDKIIEEIIETTKSGE
ncbi:MAG TPA: DUF104 domain-containing protein [Candidatus Atribacteria bacterium]|nr:DUF104 domain-containing protein [Candidatus Atribacteria bacterium]